MRQFRHRYLHGVWFAILKASRNIKQTFTTVGYMDVKRAIQILKTGQYLAVPGDPTSLLYLFTPLELKETLEDIGFHVDKIESTITLSHFLPKHLEGSGEVLELLLDLEKFVRDRIEAAPYSRRMHFAARK